MSKNVWIIIVAVIVCLANVATADPNCRDDYIVPAEWELFSGTLSGVRVADYILDTGIQESICAGNRELAFLHAAAKTAMLFIENGNANNFINIANDFGITVVGDYFDELKVNVFKSGGCYEIPAWAPDANEVSQRIQNSIIPEIDDIIAELDSISDSPADRFRIFFEPDETGLDKRLEVDYGEVLILKGMLAVLKSQLEFRQAYNLAIDINDPKVEELINSTFCGEEPSVNFNINEDFLERYANLLKVLPDGDSVLAQSKQDLIDGINYYSTVIDYIESETDEQEDDLVYIDPNSRPQVDSVGEKLRALRDSLLNDTPATFSLETTKTYHVYHNSSLVGQLVLVYDATGFQGDEGTLTLSIADVPATWEVDWFDGAGANFGIDLEYYSETNGWGSGWFEGTLSSNGNEITNGTFEYWGEWCCPWSWYDGSVSGLSAEIVSTQNTYERLDLNPVFGGSGRYPNPVNPRDLLPAFDANNEAISCTFGHGLNDDATLGGILPDMNQQDWSYIYELSDCGNINCPSADVASAQGAGIGDCLVNIYDLAALASHWLDVCTQPSWCGNVDFDRDGSIDFADFAKLADEWLQQGGP